VRGWIKALPLGLGVPIMIGASSVKPEDAASNLAAWAKWVGIHDVPTWLNTPGIDGRVITGTILIAAISDIHQMGRRFKPNMQPFRVSWQAGAAADLLVSGVGACRSQVEC
jgi:hypothetical protein